MRIFWKVWIFNESNNSGRVKFNIMEIMKMVKSRAYGKFFLKILIKIESLNLCIKLIIEINSGGGNYNINGLKDGEWIDISEQFNV